MTHTPGPWKALGLCSPFGYVIKYDKKDGKESIAYIQAYDIDNDDPEPYGEWSEESKANHNLVLAAPDLLAALKFVMSAHGEQPTTAFEQAQDAIKKAEGG